jgi:hypothetical protein
MDIEGEIKRCRYKKIPRLLRGTWMPAEKPDYSIPRIFIALASVSTES